ncbi:hypothetical protein AN214_01828 [Pseudoalteromonas sp. P1-9]|uniref:hypothetical protein n=1 Tax=Pseudoalteromonas sp. P1-9 TaxID=1710354 RepID=UPI0006D5FD1A|nr:hypothetical protein [Pseudoalteromonas sp. P1-9]KPV96019.1 hypothetical protein AN214_01828 [Pseudoalteromonas sp. P1-9]
MQFDLAELTCLLLFAIAVIKSLNATTRHVLLSNQVVQRSVLAISLMLVGFWSLKAGLYPGLDIHVLALTGVTLTLGPRLSILTAALSHSLQLGLGLVPFEQIGSYALFTSLLPILFSYALFLMCYQYITRHLFVYIFVNSFLGAGLTAVFHIGLMTGYHYFSGHYDWQILLDNYTFLASLIWFPEATINGMAMTVLIIYHPHWVRTFYDNEYLAR